jgi:flagellar motility protein MotE (MotC chaperone)
MSRAPRLLPLIAVAIGGVLAMKALGAFEGAPHFLKEAKARAETAAPGDASGKSAKGKLGKGKPGWAPAASPLASAAADGLAASSQPAGGALAPPPGIAPAAPELVKASTAPVCAPTAAELAKEAGLSPAELRVLQSLQARRGQLDQREQAIQTELALLQAAEAKVDAKIQTFNDLKAQVQGLMGEADQKAQAEIDRLVTVYQAMRPQDAAAVMAQLDDKVRLPVAGKMKPRALAAILAQMPAAEAKKLTEKLAGRFTPPSSVADAAADQPASASQPASRGKKPGSQGA